ncbi:MAG: murein hydrolase activator EnvC family protein [Parashewanella sp.]
MKSHLFYKAISLGFMLCISGSIKAENLENRQAELKAIQAKIDAQRSDLSTTRKQRSQLVQLLKRDELAISHAAKLLNKSRQQSKMINGNLKDLQLKSQNLTKLKKAQQATLAKQIESAYLSGSHDYTKLLLNQQDPSTIERMLAYYKYLNKARIGAIDQLKETIDELTDTEVSLSEQQQKLAAVIKVQTQQSRQLSQEQVQRKNTLKQLQRTLSSKSEQLEQLQIEEASLKHVIEQALMAASAQPNLKGLKALKRKLKWPTKGRIQKGFGNIRGGPVRWKGVLMSAPEGQSINAIADGKVIYADWLKGFGMVIVLDHGEGYMSLYGHAQALLKSNGDGVLKGESLALVGRSGGQAQPGLYFEIRYKGEAVDPARYCR